ncbi:hypothetical protein [Leifsonia aquatica]|uniref:hypothetical protein n=1 Tax=Leifsonia aquatica TaxID=144185 RepID=UPI00380A58D7
MMIAAIDNTPVLDADSLLRMAQTEFGAENVTFYPSRRPQYTEYQVMVEEPDQPSFRVEKYTDGHLSTDGTPDQAYRVAAAVRASLPDVFPRVVLVNDDASEYVDLEPGMSADDIAHAWRDVSEGGF